MRHLDLSLPTPAENLACDEALLDDREAHDGPGILRFWESTVPFIVVGYAARVPDEVHVETCEALSVPVLRRCSGGGTVLQGPGCLNYSLILPLTAVGPAATVTDTNRFVMERHRATFEALLRQPVKVAGHTDLVIADRKFSGNAQRRRRDWFLFHGTFLLGLDLPLIERVLRPPSRQPDYRRQRHHLEFLTHVAVAPEMLKSALKTAWQASAPLEDDLRGSRLFAAIEQLSSDRYSRPDWNRASPP